MNSSKSGIAGEKGRERVSTKPRTIARKTGVLLLPVLTAAPIVAAFVYLMIHFGPTIRKLLNILIKMAVRT